MHIFRRLASPYFALAGLLAAFTLSACHVKVGNSPAPAAQAPAPAAAPAAPRGDTPRFAYVASPGNGADAGAIWVYSVGADGGLTAITSVAAGKHPNSIAIHPSGRYAYVAHTDMDDNSVAQYNIGFGGGLTPMAVPSVPTDANTAGNIVVDPTGRYVYVANWNSSRISQFAVGRAGGLTPIGKPLQAGNKADWIAIDPSGKYAYVADEQNSQILQYNITANGSLAPMALPSVRSASAPMFIAIEPKGRFAYVANGLGGTYGVSAYSINPANGQLTQISCGPVGTKGCTGNSLPTNFAAGGSPLYIAFDPKRPIAYVAEWDGQIAQFTIGANGNLNPDLRTRKFFSMPSSIAVDPSGKYIYVTSAHGNDNSVSQFTLDSKSHPVPMDSAKVGAGSGPSSIAILAR